MKKVCSFKEIISWNNDRSPDESFTKADKDQFDFEEYLQNSLYRKGKFMDCKPSDNNIFSTKIRGLPENSSRKFPLKKINSEILKKKTQSFDKNVFKDDHNNSEINFTKNSNLHDSRQLQHMDIAKTQLSKFKYTFPEAKSLTFGKNEYKVKENRQSK